MSENSPRKVRWDVLKSLCKEKGMSLDSLRKAAKLSKKTFERWSQGQRGRVFELTKVENVLDVPYTEFVYPPEPPPPKRSGDVIVHLTIAKLPPVVVDAITALLERFANLQYRMDVDGMESGSTILHVRMTTHDALRLVRFVERLGRISPSGKILSMIRLTRECFTRPSDPPPEKARDAIRAITQIHQIHFPETEEQEEIYWNEFGDQRKPREANV